MEMSHYVIALLIAFATGVLCGFAICYEWMIDDED